MARKHFRTRAELERQMDAARQLRAETLAGGGWIFSALAELWAVIRSISGGSPLRAAPGKVSRGGDSCAR